ncbi:MAG: hypothetical protein GTN79_08890 [Gammaproteobacteria bacterium]|nr:hypothetical protein [Gammaproteobacteria bacterium]NIQ26784.1 hypothetical protein [Gammaproteobacteria bacterium]NIR19838.1 hypothetical protein [Gammaproteobacteria bacterium]
MAVSVLAVGTAPLSPALDAPALATLHDHGTTAADDAVVTGNHSNECGHHTADLDCPSCPACSGIPASGPVAMVAHRAEAASEYTAHLEQVAPRRELPPPKHA